MDRATTNSRRNRRRTAGGLSALLAALVLALAGAPAARAAGDASRAAGFIEAAQNRDGGFGAKPGATSDARATLWASVALLAAGKNPRDEFVKRGASADDYLVAHARSYSNLQDLGLLAIVQRAGRFGASSYANPAARIVARLTSAAVRQDPAGAALAIIGLLAGDAGSERQTAERAAAELLSSLTSDGAWGPDGNADSESTALVLQALAAAGAVSADTPAVTSAVAYLQAAQGNDGSISQSTRVDKATAGGSVAATAFALQALDALGLPTLRTQTGTTLRQGLTQYQQRSSGGLTAKGSQYSQVAPSVIETAQAFGAFDGVTYPLTPVRSVSGGPDALRKRSQAKGAAQSSRRVSAGTSADGVSGASATTTSDPGAFKQATADARKRDGKAKAGKLDAKRSAKARRAADGAGGAQVSGAVVGAAQAPRLKVKAGADDAGLTSDQRAAVLLAGLLLAFAGLGAVAERGRPRPAGAPPLSIAAVLAVIRASHPARRLGRRVAGVDVRHAATGALFGVARRWPLLAVLAVGVGLVALPSATRMHQRAPHGAAMVEQFKPYMRAERLDSFQRDVRQADAFARESLNTAPALLLGKDHDPQTAQADFLARSPQTALFSQQWPGVHRTFTDLLHTIQANRANYEAVAAMPSFRLMPWFFVVPGAALVLLSLAGLVLGRRGPRWWIPVRRATIALGAVLLLAPVALQMFDRAPRGAHMVDAFATVETRANVQKVQGDFGTIALGQGAIRAELYPALKTAGLSAAEIHRRLPAAEVLRKRWVAILNNITPMIGVMSDNVANYRAVAALPDFTLLPWLFALPGLLVLGLGLLAGRRPVTPSGPGAPEAIDSIDTSDLFEDSMPRLTVPAVVAAVVAAGLLAAAPAGAATPLVGTFKVAPGKVVKRGKTVKASGSYFRMIYPRGSVSKGPFFANSDSKARDKTYTLFRPGIDGGLRSGGFQPQPAPPFAPNGFALANRIIKPLAFAGINFSLSTDPVDKQSALKVTAPAISLSGRHLSGDLRAFTASWNSIYFNQGAPKPNGKLAGKTRRLKGLYNAKTGHYTLDWVSQIVGGPFNDFAGYWHFEGTFAAG